MEVYEGERGEDLLQECGDCQAEQNDRDLLLKVT